MNSSISAAGVEDSQDTSVSGPDAFKAAAKKFQLRRLNVPFGSGRRLRHRLQEEPTDFSDLLHATSNAWTIREQGAVRVLSLPGHPGFHLLPQFLRPEQQSAVFVAALTAWAQPPNRTSLSAAHGCLPDLWGAARQGLCLAHDGDRPCWRAGGEGPAAAHMLRQLRWAVLGLQYDWTRRAYDPAPAGAAQLPAQLCSLASAALGAAGCLPPGRDAFQPDAALVQLYHPGDTLNGHKDDAEHADMPIVSISAGCDAVLLLGGLTNAVPPTAIRLRSGDVVVMAGAARRCLHGVPRILPLNGCVSCPAAFTHEQLRDPVQLMDCMRVNISVRQVNP